MSKKKKRHRPAAGGSSRPSPPPAKTPSRHPPRPPVVPPPKPRPKKRPSAFVRTVRDVVVIVGLYVVIRLFAVEANVIPSGSMEDTLLVGDNIFADKFTYLFRAPRVGEIITFTHPYRDMTAWESVRFFLRHFLGEIPGGPTLLIKRVVALPGDTIELKGTTLYRNGRPVAEPYARYVNGGALPFKGTYADGAPYVVPPGHYFIMGDNRDNSLDGRWLGPVPRKYVKGKAEILYFSLAPVTCPRHGTPVEKTAAGWRCASPDGEAFRPGLDFEPTTRWRFDRRIRWSRIGRLVRLRR